MFGKFARVPAAPVSSTPSLVVTSLFLTCVVEQGFRLSYGALAVASRILGEDLNAQIPAQRGGKLVRVLPVALQPFVCKKSGKYGKGVVWSVEVPGDLLDRPVIVMDQVAEAIEVWRENSAE